MTNKSKLSNLYLSLFDCKTSEDFHLLFSEALSLSDDELLRFIKRTGVYQSGNTFKCLKKNIRIKYSEYFWLSQIPIEKAKLFFTGAFAEEILFGYFSKSENCNPALNKVIAEINPQAFCKILKITQAFIKDEWYNSILFLKSSFSQNLKNTFREITYFKNVDKDWQERKIYFSSILTNFNVDEILIQTISYFEKYKRSARESTNNKAILVSKEVTLCYVLNRLLNDYRKHFNKEKNEIIISNTIEQFYAKLHQELPPLNPPEGIFKNTYLPTEVISEEKKLIRDVIEFYFSFYSFGITMDKYCIGLLDFEMIDVHEAFLISNKANALFERNDKKNHYSEFYYLNGITKNLKGFDVGNTSEESRNFERIMSVKSTLHQMQEFCIKPKDFSIENTIDLLWNFSTWLMPQGRTILTHPVEETEEGTMVQPVVLKKEMPENFAKLFSADYLVVMEEKELVDSCTEYFKWSAKDVKGIINFLTFDLNINKSYEVDLLTHPLIKIDTKYYWLSSLLRDRNWANLLFRRLAVDKINSHSQQAKDLEYKMASQFINAGFKAVASKNYNNDEGEIDCIAYKDGVLVFLELKTTYLCEDLIRQSEFDNRKLEYKAAEQLDRATTYLKDNFEDFIRSNPELNINVAKEEIKIISLIVSNIFDWDETLKNNAHQKISLLELEIILKNSLYDLLNVQIQGGIEIPINIYDSTTNSNNPYFRNQQIDCSRDNCDLWKEKELTTNRFIQLIENNHVWSFLDKLWEFYIPSGITLNTFDPANKWLS